MMHLLSTPQSAECWGCDDKNRHSPQLQEALSLAGYKEEKLEGHPFWEEWYTPKHRGVKEHGPYGEFGWDR